MNAEREAARDAMARNPFFAAWRPDVLDLYIQYGLTEAEGGVTLKMDRFQVHLFFVRSPNEASL